MIDWRDFLYFSKGERQALVLLLLLITIGSILLVFRDKIQEDSVAETQFRYIVQPENAPLPIPIDTTQRLVALRSNRHKPLPSRKPQAVVRTEKFPAGSIVELNTADTVTLKKVPGIGSVFAHRIVKYRTLLGGFYSVEQLREVYGIDGIDEERFLSLQKWFYADTSFIAKLPVNYLPSDTLSRHPYISYKQARLLHQLSRRKGRLDGWEDLHLMEEFTDADRVRLSPYLSFQ
ncbi:MAG: helix-hairpin-helix domain-containing protein [Tannerellaceae bacterium]|jgi:DNA uptake protein ComE-like DNA-binding protein|nr:helix-hairpin-helix domain-containing protein [Tannerellaceae bacterium]